MRADADGLEYATLVSSAWCCGCRAVDSEVRGVGACIAYARWDQLFLCVQYSGLGGQAPRRLGQAPSDVTPEAIVNRLAGGPHAHGFPGLDIHADPQFQEFNRIYTEQVLLRS